MKTLLRCTINNVDDTRMVTEVCQSIADQLCGHLPAPIGKPVARELEATKRELGAVAAGGGHAVR